MPSPIKVFKKCIEKNPAIDYAISTIVSEYDIKAAHPTALYFVKGPEVYEKLMAMPKIERSRECGLMIGREPGLHEKLSKLILKWFNEFCDVNNIKESNFVSSTRDSIILVNKKPIKTTFENGLVEFRSKDSDYTSYIRIQPSYKILYDGMSNTLRIKGIAKELVEANPPFIKLFKQLLALLEISKNIPTSELLRKSSYLRDKYIKAKDLSMYASLFKGNQFEYFINGEKIDSGELIPGQNESLIRSDNYTRFFLPILKLCFKPH